MYEVWKHYFSIVDRNVILSEKEALLCFKMLSTRWLLVDLNINHRD